MIDLKQLRENPSRFKDGAARKGVPVDIDRLLELDGWRRNAMAEQEALRAEQGKLEKELGPLMGKLSGQLKSAPPDERSRIQAELDTLKARPSELKHKIQLAAAKVASHEPEFNEILLRVPLPPDPDVPVGKDSADNVEIRRWAPAKDSSTANGGAAPTAGFNPSLSYEQNRGFRPKNHIDLVRDLRLADFDRGVKMAGTRSYVLTGDGMALHLAILRYATDFMVFTNGFSPMSVPVLVREECMTGTGFFPAGREQAYHVEESKRGGGNDLFLTGTGEVGLMGIHQGEILEEASLPLRYVTVSTCFRREAGAAGKDTAGLYRIHQFDKVEQVIICKADEQESRTWHKTMIGYVEAFLQSLALPYRLLQCCSGDLGVKNADMIDIECWMPGRGEATPNGATGDWGETHSASRLYDYQCRRLNMRYRPGGDAGKGATQFCHSLNNTVCASPRILIPILEMYQNADGSVTIPKPLRPYMNNRERIEAKA